MNTATRPASHESGRGVARFTLRGNPHPRPERERRRILAAPRFGAVCTDHMARITFTGAAGWSGHRVEPYAPFQLDPAAAVLHYGQEVFEGLKAYRHHDGSVWAFRPEKNAARLAASARRLALPQLPEEDFLDSISALVRTDIEWVPTGAGTSLYLWPFMIASEPFLGVRPARSVDYAVIASPAGPYFASGAAPVSIWVATDQHRTGPGGTGAAKCGGNYAASLDPQRQAAGHGCDQVCFLDAATGTYLEEIGSMNLLLVTADGAVHTPALTGTILEGVTRASILELLRAQGVAVHERDITLTEVQQGVRTGEITEVLACGTAASVTPIGRLAGPGFDLTVAGGRTGEITASLQEQLTAIQYGTAADPRGWMYQLG